MPNALIADAQKTKKIGRKTLKRTSRKSTETKTTATKNVYELTIDQPMLSYALESYLSQFNFMADDDRIILGSLPSKFTIKVQRDAN